MSTSIINKEGIKYDSFIAMETVICYKCAVPFGIPGQLKQHLQSSQDTFFCPNGHEQHYTKSTESILREKLERQQKEAEAQAQALKARLFDTQQEAANWQKQWSNQLSEKKKVELKLKRLNNGVCSCCNRTFSNLAEHVKNEHPELIGKEKPKHNSKTNKTK